VLNAERAREEQRLGLGGKKRSRTSSDDGDAADDTPKGKKLPKGQGKLF
jgi:hypothetical protein